jgi:putative protease
MVLKTTVNGIAIDLYDERGNNVSLPLTVEYQEAKSPQEESRRRVLSKTGNTIYRVEEIEDNLGNVFIPASVLTDLRRKALDLLDEAQITRYKTDKRLEEDKSASLPQGNVLTYHDNVANSLSREFYCEHGATHIESAIEVQGEIKDEMVVMNTRYCLRREMGCCLKTPNARKWVGPLYLQSANNRFRLDFDCKECRMKVVYLG